MTTLRKAVIAYVVVFLNFSGVIARFTDESNRYIFHWQLSDGLTLVLTVTLIAVLVFAAWQIVVSRGWKNVERVLQHLFLLATASGVFAAIPGLKFSPNQSALAWFAAALVVGYSWGRRDSKVVKFCANFCMIASPLVLILYTQVLMWPTWSQRSCWRSERSLLA